MHGLTVCCVLSVGRLIGKHLGNVLGQVAVGVKLHVEDADTVLTSEESPNMQILLARFRFRRDPVQQV